MEHIGDVGGNVACVIMHNMIMKDERDEGLYDQGWKFQGELIASYPGAATFEEFLHMHQEVRDHTTRDQFQNNLFEHHYVFVGMAGNPIVISSCFYLFCIKLCC
jgi:hypothetical protein